MTKETTEWGNWRPRLGQLCPATEEQEQGRDWGKQRWEEEYVFGLPESTCHFLLEIPMS